VFMIVKQLLYILNSELHPLFMVIQFRDPHTCNDTLHLHINPTGKGTFLNCYGVITSIQKHGPNNDSMLTEQLHYG